jgi:hypothetical protein
MFPFDKIITYSKYNKAIIHFYRRRIPEAAYVYNLRRWPPEDERMTLERCRGTEFYVFYKKLYIKLVLIKKLYYDAQSNKSQNKKELHFG